MEDLSVVEVISLKDLNSPTYSVLPHVLFTDGNQLGVVIANDTNDNFIIKFYSPDNNPMSCVQVCLQC